MSYSFFNKHRALLETLVEEDAKEADGKHGLLSERRLYVLAFVIVVVLLSPALSLPLDLSVRGT